MGEIDDFAKKSVSMKEQIEKEIQEKEKKNIDFQTDFMNRAKKTLEKAQNERDTLVKDNIRMIQEITEKRNEIVHETENYVKEIQQKFQSELPEKQKLIEENQRLRKEIDDFA